MKRADLFFTAVLVPLDFLTLIAAAVAAYALRFSESVQQVRPIIFELPFDTYIDAVVPFALVWLVIFAISGLYVVRPHRLAVEATRVLLACSAGIAVVLGIAFFSRELFDSRFIVLAIWGLTVLFVVIERLLVRGLQRSLRRFGIGMQRVFIIGKTTSGQALKKYFQAFPRLGYEVIGHVAHFSDSTKEHIQSLNKHDRIDAILLADADVDRKQIQAIKTFSDIEHLGFLYSADLVPGSSANPIVHTLAGQPVIELPKTPLDGWGAIYKRGFDIVVSLLLIILTLPIQIITALAIIIENPGPIFFVHKRVGQRGKIYSHLKFRSMVKDAHKYRFDPEFIKKYGNEREGTPLFKLEHDPRITRVGAFIRKLSIDEIPEFYMVLSGKMSLIGPRPHLPGEVEQYKAAQKRVLTIKPGITGMAQVSGRADLRFNDEVRLDMHYIENWSPWLDLVILLKTPWVVLFGRGAY